MSQGATQPQWIKNRSRRDAYPFACVRHQGEQQGLVSESDTSPDLMQNFWGLDHNRTSGDRNAVNDPKPYRAALYLLEIFILLQWIHCMKNLPEK